MAKRSSARGVFVVCLERTQSDGPLFLQIYRTLRDAILNGKLVSGVRLPSTRTLARDLRVSRTTTEEAFAQLLAEGFIERRPGAGTFVASTIQFADRPRRAPRRAARSSPRRLAQRASSLARHACFPEAVTPRPFAASTPAVDAFPIDIWRSLVARSLRGDPRALGTADPAGYLPLRETIASYLAISRGVTCTPDRVIILTSSQQALDLAARVLVDPGDKVWVEEPGYPGARAALIANGASLVAVPVDAHGLRVQDGVRLAARARLAYVSPSHQYPLGMTMTLERRVALLDWARSQGAWILEDDYDSEFRYDGRPLAAIQGIDADQRVIYVGTFSKVLFPALRLGYAVLPEDLVEPFVVARGLIDGHPPASVQIALAAFLSEGHFGAHIRRMRDLYRERRDTLVSSFARHLKGRIELGPTEAGLHTVAYTPRTSDDRRLSERLAREGIDAQPLSRYFHGPATRRGLFLGYAALKPREIDEAVLRMARMLRSP